MCPVTRIISGHGRCRERKGSGTVESIAPATVPGRRSWKESVGKWETREEVGVGEETEKNGGEVRGGYLER